jgi:hypothetical protein
MEFNWQTFAALAVVTAAGWFLVRRMVASWHGKAQRSCADCASCSDDGSKALPLVELDGTARE